MLRPEHPDTLNQPEQPRRVPQGPEGDSAAAEPLHRRALEVRERVLGPEHPDTLQSLNNLAVWLREGATSPRPSRSSAAQWRLPKVCLGSNTR